MLRDLGILAAGAMLCNCLPHLVQGLSGWPFPTPFAKPSGIGPSGPLTNFLWGAANLAAGLLLADVCRPASGVTPFGIALAAIGFIGLGVHLALHFGRIGSDGMRGDPPTGPRP